MALLKFFCDESYDSDPNKGIKNAARKVNGTSHVPRTYVVAGFLASDIV
jgi:hypothetical protein